MEDEPVEKLREIIIAHGRGIVVEPARCAGLLRDYCGMHRREASVLIGALNEGIPSRLIQSETSAGTVTFDSLSSQLQLGIGYSEEAARWAVRAWSTALGIKERVSSSSGSLRPPGISGSSSSNSAPPVLPPPLPQPFFPSNIETEFRGETPARPFIPNPDVDPLAGTEDAERWIRWAWIAANVSAGYSILAGLILNPNFFLAPWILLVAIQNAIAIFALGMGVRGKSRLGAVLLFSYHLLSTLVTWMNLPNAGFFLIHKLLILAFFYFYGRGIQAAFTLHDMEVRRRA